MKKHLSERVVGALFFITMGIVFMLNTMGYLPWSFWLVVLKLWPALIILWGLRLLFGNNWVGNVWGVFFYTTVLIAAFLVAFTDISLGEESRWETFVNNLSENVGDEQESSEEITVEEYEDAAEVELSVDLGLGQMDLTDELSDNLVFLESNYFENFGVPELDVEEKDALEITFSQESINRIVNLNAQTPSYDMTLGGSEVTYAIDIDLGAGQFTGKLNEVMVSSLYANIGAGEMKLELGEESLPEKITINVGAGSFTLTIPDDIDYQLDYSLGIGSLDIEGKDIDGLGRDGSLGNDDPVVVIILDVGVGEFTLKTK